LRQLGANANEDGTITITAPISGTVADRETTLGESGQDAGKKIMTIVNGNSLLMSANIYEKDLDKIQIGQSVTVKVNGQGQQVLRGRISVIGATVQGDSRVVPVKAELDNANGSLKPGMFAELAVLTDRSLAAILAIPKTAIVETNDKKKIVYVQNGNAFQAVEVALGRAPGDSDAGGVNFAHLDVDLSEKGLADRPAAIRKLREELAKLPGVATGIGGFISHRMDEVLSGVRSQIAIKVFGADLATLRTIGQQVETQMRSVSGLVDLQLEPQVPINQVQIVFNRDAAAREGLTIGQLTDMVETALNGRVVSQVLEAQQTFDLLVWLKPEARSNLTTIENLLIDKPDGGKIPLAQVATVGDGTGPNTINREKVSRLIVVSANVSGRDLRSTVNEIQAKVQQNVPLPAGYFVQYGGQFEAEERATQNILVFSLIAFVVICVLMYLSVQLIASTIMIMINLPIGLVGGVIAVALTGGVISVASLVGFVTLFGVATRNGLLLVDNYNTKFATGMPLKEILNQGSMERLNAILITALTSALGLAPLVVAGGAGKEILQPLAIVVLGGLFTSTALTLLIIPALYARFGRHLFARSTP
jgi:Cu/Ag efflux pump CusA